ncbi:MAG TPA: hypothetical protein PKA90_14015 [Ignavibacteria bacterium]|nr:hypothetical protein [Ignavibacteria bacterium]HMR41535.1 hypothetical protein [Ignavibacteria bacterium]
MWKISFILPNIKLSNNVETDYLALVNFEDERITKIIEEENNALKLLNGFKNDSNDSIKPAVLIYKEFHPDKVISTDSMVTFRDIVAISTILSNWSLDYSEASPFGPLFSNSYDFYPITIGKDGNLKTINPATTSFHSPNSPFLATPSREVSRVESGLEDPILYKALIGLWKQKYELGKEDNIYSIKVFRSLEMAYYALSIPSKNESSEYDYGLILTLWVSAIEILVKPKDKNVTKIDVINFLKSHGLKDPNLNLDFQEINIGNNQKLNINFIQKLYLIIYDYRSNYIHGDEINNEIFEFIKEFPN